MAALHSVTGAQVPKKTSYGVRVSVAVESANLVRGHNYGWIA